MSVFRFEIVLKMILEKCIMKNTLAQDRKKNRGLVCDNDEHLVSAVNIVQSVQRNSEPTY